MIDQITVFLENTEGRLAAMCRTLADAGVNMSALSIADTTDFGVVRIIADDPEKAVQALTAKDYRAAITSVAAIAVPNEPGGLAKLLETLDSAKLNIEYGYCFSIDGDNAVDVLKFRSGEAASEATDLLEESGFKVLSQADLA